MPARDDNAMKVLGLAGWSGSGKTTLLVALLPLLVARGLTVSTVKHAHHSFDVDRPGKDSFRHRAAGASEVLIASAQRWALMHEHRGADEPDLQTLLAHVSPVDLILVEGFKHERHAKIEVHRAALGQPLLCREDPSVIALATDAAPDGVELPVLDLNDIEAVAGFVADYARSGERAA